MSVMKMMLRAVAGCGLMIAAAGMGSCGDGGNGAGVAGTTIKVGSLNSMTGLNSTFGQSSDKGIRLAAKERNAKGPLLGKTVEIVTADTESSPQKTPLAMLKLLEQDKVCTVLGEVASSRSKAAAPEAQRNRVPLLSPASTNPTVTQIGDYVFRSCFTDDFQGVLIAKFTAENLKINKAALLVDVGNDYSTGLAKVLEAEFPKLGGTIVGRENYSAGATNFKTQLTNLKSLNPDIVFLPGYYTEVAPIVNQARELGMTCPFIGGDGWDSEVTLKMGGKSLEGCYYTNHYFAGDQDPKVVEFVAKYKKEFNGESPDAMAALGYDAANILFKAIEDAGSADPPKIRDALAKTKDFPAVTGSITIDAERNAKKPGVVLKFEGGAIKMVTRVQP